MKNNPITSSNILSFEEKTFIENGDNYQIYNEEGFDKMFCKLHEHNFGEVFFLIEGSVTYIIEEGHFPLKPYDCIFIPPHTLHQVVATDKNVKFKRMVLWIYTTYLDELSSEATNLNEQIWRYTSAGNYLIRDIEFGVNFKSHIEKIIDLEKGNTFGKEILIRNELSSVFLSISRYLLEEDYTKIAPSGNQKVLKVIQYIGSHLSEELKLSSLAEIVNLDEYYLSHLFSKEVGVTIHQYIIKKRLTIVKKMLDKNMNLKDIVPLVGFKDSSHLIQTFKKEYGITPNKYKQLTRKKA